MGKQTIITKLRGEHDIVTAERQHVTKQMFWYVAMFMLAMGGLVMTSVIYDREQDFSLMLPVASFSALLYCVYRLQGLSRSDGVLCERERNLLDRIMLHEITESINTGKEHEG